MERQAVQGKIFRDRLLDPMQYDAFLKAFNDTGPLASARGDTLEIERLEQATSPTLGNGLSSDNVFATLKNCSEEYPQPCLVVSDLGLIMALNRPAHIAFDLDVSDHIDRCGIESKDAIPLSQRIAQIIASDHEGQQTFFCRADYKDAERPILLAIVPHHAPEHDHRSALVFFIDIGWDEAIGRFISRAYALSQSEQDILEFFILGNSLEQIAEIRGRSYKTVRTQFYSALNKCGMSSQVDLVREVVAGAMFQSFVPKVANASKHPHRRELHMLRPGGRTLEVIVSGDVKGKPVFMLASAGPQKFAPQKTKKFKDAGVCIYSISPPGLGYTDPEPEGTCRMDCLAEDVASVMDQLGVSSVPFLCLGSNLVSTVRLAAKIPRRMTEIQSWITIPPARFRTEAEAKETPNAVSAMGNASMISPAMRKLVTRSSIRALAILGTRKMAKFQVRSEPEIAEMLLEPDTIDAIDEGFKSWMRQGFTKTVVTEAEDVHSDWFDDACACPVPIKIVHGVRDKTNSIESIHRFAAAFPDMITLDEVPNGGGFLHVTHEDLHVAYVKDLVG
ncbi:bifunctional helix-turn-helix transcriptional regulator/alpha/beta hydrolase [Gymnodinialimonas sp.]